MITTLIAMSYRILVWNCSNEYTVKAIYHPNLSSCHRHIPNRTMECVSRQTNTSAWNQHSPRATRLWPSERAGPLELHWTGSTVVIFLPKSWIHYAYNLQSTVYCWTNMNNILCQHILHSDSPFSWSALSIKIRCIVLEHTKLFSNTARMMSKRQWCDCCRMSAIMMAYDRACMIVNRCCVKDVTFGSCKAI